MESIGEGTEPARHVRRIGISALKYRSESVPINVAHPSPKANGRSQQRFHLIPAT